MQVGDLVEYRHGVGVVLDFFRRPGRHQLHTYVNCYWLSLGVKTSVPVEAIRESVISQRRRNYVSRQD